MSQLRRREILTKVVGERLYEGFIYGSIYGQRLNTSYISVYDADGEQFLTKLFPCSDITGHKLRWVYNADGLLPKDYNHTDYAQGSCAFWTNAEGEGGSIYGASGSRPDNGVITGQIVPDNAVTFRVCSTVPLDDFYILDITTNTYIFKGKNVE